jgi:dihydropteroate synthase
VGSLPRMDAGTGPEGSLTGTAAEGSLTGVVAPYPSLQLGRAVVDISSRTIVMGILNRTPDSFYDQGATWGFDAFVRRAEELVVAGADLLDVGGVKAGPGAEVDEAEELDRVVPAIEALHARFDVPISADTWRASVLDEACKAGAVVGNDISGFADPDYLTVAARHGATVVATHIRLAPRVPDPEPVYADLVADVGAFLLERAQRAEAAGLTARQIVLDAGLDLGKTPAMSAVLLRESAAHATLGYPFLLSASNKRFFGELLDLDIGDRRAESLAALAYGVIAGCRIVRVHDVAGSVRVCRTIETIVEQALAGQSTVTRAAR